MAEHKVFEEAGTMTEMCACGTAGQQQCVSPGSGAASDTEQRCCAAHAGSDREMAGVFDQPFVTGAIETPVGKVPVVAGYLTGADHWGTVKARLGVGRMTYTVKPGLYAVGSPDDRAPVLVTANYKLSFDSLRACLRELPAWLLVLDTGGINVWCAAGKGTLGTEALVHSIVTNGLAGLVVHRTVVLPQLAAPGVAAHAVKSASGFRVVYGPIRAVDVEAFVRAGMKADPEQRRKTFGLGERAVLIPVELVEAVRWALILSPALLVIGGLTGPEGFWANVPSSGVFAVLGMFSGVVAGAIATPLLLPWLPGRAFSVKGIIPGLVAAAAVPAWRGHWPGASLSGPEAAGWTLMIVAIASYLAMNFTGASTYTSLSGVRKEMRFALPAQVAAVIVGLGLWLLPSLLS